MRVFGYAVAGLGGAGIIYIGVRYVTEPEKMAPTFGLPDVPPGDDPFQQLKGIRDITSGLVVLALAAARRPRTLALAMLVEALTPVGDMLVVLRRGGSRATAFGVHGATAATLVAGAAALAASAQPPDSAR